MACCLSAGCSTAYYKAMETVGVEKRDILVDRVEDARNAQDKAQVQFQDALEQYRSVVDYDGGDLEDFYDRLRETYEDSEDRADTVRDRITSVKKVANDLFEEWEEEIEEYQSDDLRRKSESQLRKTRKRYGQLIGSMDRAAASMDPVLATLHDQVLFLKHNLNARALGALQDTADALQGDVDRLVRDMQAAIDEADRFIADMSPD